MLTLVLPGYSIKNRDWLFKTKEYLRVQGDKEAYEWRHWSSGAEMDVSEETDILLRIVGKEKVNFIAKSIGTKVLMSLIPKIHEQINKVILCGIPIDPIKHLQGIRMINKKNLWVFQNSQDPLMSYKVIENYIHLIDKDIQVIEKISSIHDYPYYEDFNKLLS